MENFDKTITQTANDLLTQMGVDPSAKTSYDSEQDNYIVTIEGGNATGLLIGRKGETLTSFQTILSLIIKQKTGEWKRIMVNIGDYREKEEDYLTNLGKAAAARARETGEPQPLYNLTPAQRRIVHLTLSEDDSIVTESVGEGTERYLLVKAK